MANPSAIGEFVIGQSPIQAGSSATGGYLTPTVASPPIEGAALYDFFHDVVVGITGLDPTMVRPRWIAEPANIPDAGNAWAAVGFNARPSDTYPYIEHDADGDGSDQLQRHERIDILVSFYDLGTDGLADYLAALFRDGLAIEQNRAAMQQGGFVLAFVDTPTPAPQIVKTRWLYRVDFPFSVRRQIDRTYRVLNILSAQGTLYSSGPVPAFETDISVNPPPSP